MEIEFDSTNSILSLHKNCKTRGRLLFEFNLLNDMIHFFCQTCHTYTKWCYGTILNRLKIPISLLKMLMTMFLDKKTPTDSLKILNYKFIDLKLNIKTIIHYFSMFDRIVMSFYLRELDFQVFNNQVELDESYLFKPKASFAPHRAYSNAVWIFGLYQRNNKKFIIFPVTNRTEANLHNIIIRYIEKGSQIYSDCFSSYVNNRSCPKRSKLEKYGYIHKFINHKKELVSTIFPDIHTNNIENTWRLLKQYIRRQKVTTNYPAAIARFYFYSTVPDVNQMQILIKGLQQNSLENYIELSQKILNKF